MSDYCTKGYVLLVNFFNNREMSILKTGAKYLQNMPEIVGGPMKYFEKSQSNGEIILNRVENFCSYLPLVNNIVQSNKIRLLIRELTTRDYIIFKDKINYKLPGGGGFKPHQDGAAFNKFVNDELVTIMIPIHMSNEANGCLRIPKYEYKKTLLPHKNGSIAKFERCSDNVDWQNIYMNPGDILCFSSYLVHQSKDNLSNLARNCYFLTFSPSELGDQRENYFKFKREKFPPRIEREPTKDYESWRNTLAREII